MTKHPTSDFTFFVARRVTDSQGSIVNCNSNRTTGRLGETRHSHGAVTTPRRDLRRRPQDRLRNDGIQDCPRRRRRFTLVRGDYYVLASQSGACGTVSLLVLTRLVLRFFCGCITKVIIPLFPEIIPPYHRGVRGSRTEPPSRRRVLRSCEPPSGVHHMRGMEIAQGTLFRALTIPKESPHQWI